MYQACRQTHPTGAHGHKHRRTTTHARLQLSEATDTSRPYRLRRRMATSNHALQGCLCNVWQRPLPSLKLQYHGVEAMAAP